MNPFRKLVLHPLFFAAYPVLALVAHNLGQVKPRIGLRALAVSLLAGLLLWILLQLIFRDGQRSALVCSAMILLFFSYGHVYQGIRSVQEFGSMLGRHRFLVPFWLVLFGLGVWLILKYGDEAKKLTQPLNLISFVLLLFPVIQIALFQLPSRTENRSLLLLESERAGPGVANAATESPPDIYYIILDAYANKRTLREGFDYDNAPFLSQLEARNFIVADCSQSNYAQTELSFASALNLSYLEELGFEGNQGGDQRERLWPLIRNSSVRQLLEQMGYKVVAFETGYYWSELEDADLYLKPSEMGPGGLRLPAGLNAFEATLLRSTLAWAIVDQAPSLPKFLVRDLDRSAEEHYRRVNFSLDSLQDLASMPGPKFVFAHIVSPHSPFVFGPGGEFVDHVTGEKRLKADEYRQGYVVQIQVLNEKLLRVIDRLIEESKSPPVIIIQGDHGPEEGSSQDRMSVLNAYYLQGQPSIWIEPWTTPVNSFRIVFNTVFGMELPLLDDVSYFSTYEAPFDYLIVPPNCPANP